MIKKTLATSLTIICLCGADLATAKTQLKLPQGRIGTNNQFETFNTNLPTNISKKELSNIKELLKDNSPQKAAYEKKLKSEQDKALRKAEKELEKIKAAEEKAKQKEIIAAQKAEEKKNKKNKTNEFTTKTQQEQIPTITYSESQKDEKHTIEKVKTKPAKKIPQDPNTKLIVEEIKTELSENRPKMLEELSTLWISAVQKSDTVYFAIMKLSNPNGEEVNKNGFKKIMEPIVGAAPLVGQAFVNPALTAGSIIGSNLMGTMMNDSFKTRLTKVNDADLVILARAIDELQEELLLNYMAYKGAKEEYDLSIRIAEDRKKEYEKLNRQNSPNTILANTFYTEALDAQYKARQEFLMKRVILEQMVGAEALNKIENGIPNEENEETSQENPEQNQSESTDKTSADQK